MFRPERCWVCWRRIFGESKNEGFVVAAIVFAVFEYVGRYLFDPINRLFCIAQPYVEPSCEVVMEAAPGCVLISVIAPYFVSDKPHELIAIALTVLAASRFSMLVTVLIGVGTSGILGYLMK
ncbi:AzlD family protein [Neisseria subflava]|uniref:AzlD family protein n=1 Tax=Neisseria subflava TaxID=28449 RepID=UPI0024A891BD|nr:AzlD domain-containing protein [Neisseria subflava]